MKFLPIAALALMAGLVGPSIAHAQADVTQLPDSVRQMVRQLEALEGRLAPIEQMALASTPELTDMSLAIQRDVVIRMIELHPSLETGMDRLMAMQTEQEAAIQRADHIRVAELMSAGSALNDSIQAARDEALEDEGLKERLVNFQEALVERMIAVDPNARLIIDEMRALGVRIDKADMGGGGS